MAVYLKRLISSVGAYQVADAVSKVLAVLLLPVYTSRIAPAGYGIVETLTTFVVFVSIVVRFGIIESFLRFYFVDRDPERRDALARRAVLFLLCTTTIACAILVVPAAPLSRLVTSKRRARRLPGGRARSVVVHEPGAGPGAAARGRAPPRLRDRDAVQRRRDDHRLGRARGGVRHGLHRTVGRQLRGVDDRPAGLVVDDAPASVAATASGRRGVVPCPVPFRAADASG